MRNDDTRIMAKLVSVFLVLSVCLLGYVTMSTFGQPIAMNGKVSIDSAVQFKQNDNVSYYFVSDSYVDRLEIAPTYFEINTLKMTTGVSTGNVNVTLYDIDPSDNYLKWRADQDVSTASVSFRLDGLNVNTRYDWLIDGNVVGHSVSDTNAFAEYTYSGPWSSHLFVVQESPGPFSILQASFEYVIDGNMVEFKDKSYGDVVTHVWNFGDGVGSTKQSPTHTFVSEGVYPVSLTVYDLKGADSKAQTNIKIALGPDNPFERDNEGWNVFITNDLTVSISAIGLLVFGSVMYVSAIILPVVPIITPKGRKIIGALMVIAGIYYFVFKDNSWWS